MWPPCPHAVWLATIRIADTAVISSGVGTGGAGGACAPPNIIVGGGHCPPPICSETLVVTESAVIVITLSDIATSEV